MPDRKTKKNLLGADFAAVIWIYRMASLEQRLKKLVDDI